MDIDKLFQFEKCETGYILKSYLLKEDPSVTEVVIPSEYEGRAVVSIGFQAFMNARFLISITIPEGIRETEKMAFYSCDELKTAALPHSLRVIGRFAFNNCRKLENISFPEGLEVIEEYAFFSCRSIKSVVFPSSLRRLEQVAFCDCAGLETVIFPKELEDVGAFVFQDCVRLSSVVLPENLKTIGVHFFKNCRKLESVELPDSLREIGAYAFDLSGLRSVRLPAGLEKVGTLAFFFCQKLERVEFGNNSTVLELRVFAGCPELAAENVLQGLIGSSDVTKPFTYSEEFEWVSALREDVFKLALKYNSFALFDKGIVFAEIVKRGLVQLLPLVENAGWDIADIMEKCFEEFLDISMKKGFTEITAWLLDYKNRKLGFENEKNEY